MFWTFHLHMTLSFHIRLKHLATTPYCYLLTAMFACIVMGDTIMHNLTIILNGRGYSSAHANFMSVGVFMFSIFPSLVLARTSDTLRHKGLHVFLVSCWSAMWYMFSALVDTQVILFGAAYSATLNAILMPITLNWASQIYACDHDMRAIILPVIVTFGNLIPYLIRPLTWEVTDAPDYGKLFPVFIVYHFIWLLNVLNLLLHSQREVVVRCCRSWCCFVLCNHCTPSSSQDPSPARCSP